MSCWWSRNGWQSIRFEIGAIILCQQFVLCWSGVSCVTNHFCVSGVSLIFFCSLPPSYLTHFSPLCTTYFHAVSQLAARSPLLLGNFRKAILVHCLGLDWSGPRECGRGVCVWSTKTERKAVWEGESMLESCLTLMTHVVEETCLGFVDPWSSCLSVGDLHW